MSYGIQIFSGAGDTIVDTSRVTYAVIAVIPLVYGATGYSDYPDFVGWNLFVAQTQDGSTGALYTDVFNISKVVVSVTTSPEGAPRVSWGSWSSVGAGQGITLMVLGN